jgi:hypothetical protein
MSNDLTLSLSNDLPDYLKEVGLDDMTKALAGNTGTKRISIRGGVFRMMVNGEEIAKNENRAMNIVIVNGAAKVARSFYAGKYVAGEATHPDCWSNDGDKPDASIEHPQASACEGCPQNIKGSGQGDSRACRYQQRLAVVLADDVGGDVFQLVLPAKSIFGRGDNDKMPFQQYAKYVGSQGKSLSTLVTEMRMDSDSDTPKLTFKPVRFLSRDEWIVAKEKGDSPAAKSAVIQTPSQTDGVKKKQLAAPQGTIGKRDANTHGDIDAVPETEVPEPTKRPAKKNVEPAAKKEFNDVLKQWTDD